MEGGDTNATRTKSATIFVNIIDDRRTEDSPRMLQGQLYQPSFESVSEPLEVKNRENWANSVEFLMSCISVSVGLGNIWRFPFTAYENGGGAFIIPYVVVLLLIGKPMYYLEVLMGQFTSKSSVKIWSVCPAFIGVGIGQAYAGIAVLTYYSSLLALTLFYLVASFQPVLPWSYCRREWGPNCVDSLPNFNQTRNDIKLQSSSELYFLKTVIHEIEDLSQGIGMPSWRLTVALFVAWVVTYMIIVRGIKTTGKAAYFLAMFPYAILITLLIRAVTLEGAIDGIIYFLKPNWSELLNFSVWKAAVVQCFFSLAVGLGPLVMFSSYNKFNHNVRRDTLIVTSLDTLTSLIAGITIFGILGNLAFNLKVTNIDEVVRSSTGLAFVSYPDAIAKFTAFPQLFAILFFFMLFVLGIGTLVAQANTLVAILCDQYKWMKASTVALAIAVGGFLSGIVYVTPAGQWILNLVDYYGSTFVVFGLAVFQIIGISWIYGLQNFCDDIEFMTKSPVSSLWRICWAIITPMFLFLIFIYSMIELETLKYAGLEYPESANVAGWVLLAIGFLQFPLWAIWSVTRDCDKGVYMCFKTAFRPSSEWGPSDPAIKKEWLIYKRSVKERRKAANSELKGSYLMYKLRSIFVTDWTDAKDI
ncbi:sodium-dependent nutrient amino acid transporter 1-like [Scaptodrosophila lebanonensis]|uniref:Transporter n=1 Tax=Drosophila lebanonensis TaxID=7225 RepID=A0A6J2U0Z4_DROLE|nr:sodium-dependent nutrient amino acid transporter 1-like [Scaptodrosophila lebanonensis]